MQREEGNSGNAGGPDRPRQDDGDETVMRRERLTFPLPLKKPLSLISRSSSASARLTVSATGH